MVSSYHIERLALHIDPFLKRNRRKLRALFQRFPDFTLTGLPKRIKRHGASQDKRDGTDDRYHQELLTYAQSLLSFLE
jgi:hypothetical protein